MDSNFQSGSEFGSSSMPLAMEPQQAEVFELLRGLSSQRKEFHKWYAGAIQILISSCPDKIALAAHSMRELCDELPDAIANIPKFKSPIAAAKHQIGPAFVAVKAQSYSDGWFGKAINEPLDKALCRLEKLFSEPPRSKRFGRALTATDPLTNLLPKDWYDERDNIFETLVGFFQTVAHHKHLADELEFRERLELFESLLLSYLTPCTDAQQRELLKLIRGPANPATFARVGKLIKHKSANFSFFFDKLNNPDWLLFLDQKGLYKSLPGPEPTEDGRIIYRHYLPLMALARLAETAPQAVTDILIKLRFPGNPNVGDQVLQCMAALRDKSCIGRLGPLIDQLSQDSALTDWHWIRELLNSWLELGAIPQIFGILQSYLNSSVGRTFGEFSDTVGIWLVKQVDAECLEKLTPEYPFDIARIVFQALCKWVDLEREKYNESDVGEEAPISYFLEDFKSSPLEYHGIEVVLAIRLFSAAKQIYVLGDPLTIGQVDDMLRSNPWHLFQRLRWQLYADFQSLTLERARADVLRRIPFLNEIDYSRGCHDYEFAQLLVVHVKQHRNSFLNQGEIREFFNAVMKGPIDKEGKILDGNIDFFHRMQLWPIAPLLRGEQLKTYRALVPDDGAINIENFKPFRTGGGSGGSIISVAPKQAENLESMTDEELWKFLNEWGVT